MLLEDVATSIFRPKAYAEFARRRAGRAMVYLVLVALPLALTGAIRVGLGWTWATSQFSRALEAAPDFRITGGNLEWDAPQPYRLTVEGEEIGFIDTTGAIDRSVVDDKTSYVLVLEDRFIFRRGYQTRESTFRDLGCTNLAKDDVVAFVSAAGGWAVVLGLIWLAGSLGTKLVAALLLGVALLVVAVVRTRAVTFGGAWNLACHALTLPLLLGFVRALFQVNVRYFGLLYWGAALAYGVLATGLLPAAVVSPGGPVPPTGREPPGDGPTASG